MNPRELFDVRIALLQTFLHARGLQGLLLTRADNFAMATGGRRNYIWTHTDPGANALFVPQSGRPAFVGNAIELPRIMDEELAGFDCGAVAYPWFDGTTPADAVRRAYTGDIASDDGSIGANLHADLAVFRALLTPVELEKYRRIGALAATAMESVISAIAPGMSEAEIAALLVAEGAQRDCHVPVALVAADERIARYRHPLPTAAPLLPGNAEVRTVQRYVMVVGCFKREGLTVSLTRFRQVDDLPEEIRRAHARIGAVDAAFQLATCPGRSLGEVFDDGLRAYQEQGFEADEWHRHHQGGATGYAGRTAFGRPGSDFPVLDTQWPERLRAHTGLDVAFGAAFAWNPSAPGVKSEDTFILQPDGQREVVSATPRLAPCLVSGVAKSGIHRS